MGTSAVLKLQQVGFTIPQVEALTEFLDSQAATKADLTQVEHRLQAQLAEFRTEAKEEIGTVRIELERTAHRLEVQIAGVRSEFKAEIIECRNETAMLRAELRQLEQRITIKLGGMLVVGIGAVAVLVKLL